MNNTKKANMNNIKNSLAELAEEMQSIINALETDNFSTVGIGNLCKAQRIVAELAKVQVADGMPRRVATRANCLEYSFGNESPKTVGIFTTQHFPKWICSALNAVENCREIAEEGAKNGNW